MRKTFVLIAGRIVSVKSGWDKAVSFSPVAEGPNV